MNEVITALKLAREARRITLRELAPLVGVSHATLGQYETGTIDPPLSRVMRWAEVLGVRWTFEAAAPARIDDGLVEAVRLASHRLTAEEVEALERLIRRLSSK